MRRWYVTLSWLPQYFRDLGVELSNVGFYSVAPYLAMVLFENTWATLMDAQMNAGKLSLLNLRRLSQTVAFGCPAAVIAAMLGVGTSTPWVASAMLAAALASNMASHSGYWANMIVRSPCPLCPSAAVPTKSAKEVSGRAWPWLEHSLCFPNRG